MQEISQLKFETAVRWLVKYLPISDSESRKPRLFHSLRVGFYLYERGYTEEIVLAGLLHDLLEWTKADAKLIKKEFGTRVFSLIQACTFNFNIKDRDARISDAAQRAVKTGEAALIVKAADALDSFKWYSAQQNTFGLEYCQWNTQAILKHKPPEFKDKIFIELRKWVKKDK